MWARAALVAAVLTLVATPLLRRLALATGFVDQPEKRKQHTRPTPYLGGVALIFGVLVGTLLEPQLPPELAVLALGAALLGTMGLVDDHRTVSPLIRFLAEVAAAVCAVAVGLRIHATGIEAVDIALAIIWIVGITNAFNLLDNMDGLAAGVAAMAAGAVFVLSILGGQTVAATMAAAVVGACLAFLVYNRRPASVFMGDTGSLFLGFVLAVLTVNMDPALAPPASFAVPIMLLALPVLDTTTVTLARLRRGRSVSIGGKDHLSHRLVARGLSPGMAVITLIAIEGFVGVMSIMAGRRMVPLSVAGLAALAALAGLTIVTSRAQVYTEEVVGLPRRVKLLAGAGLGAIGVMAAPATVGLLLASGPARDAAAEAEAALGTLASTDPSDAEAQLARANDLFERARGRAHGPLTSLGLLVPGLSSNLRISRLLIDTGRTLTGEGQALSAVSEAAAIPLGDRARALDRLEALAPRLAAAAGQLRAAHGRLAGTDQPYLVPSLREALQGLEAQLGAQYRTADRAAELSRLIPRLAGEEGPRRYLLAYQDSAVLRGTGGRVTHWGELAAGGGTLEVRESGEVATLARATPGGVDAWATVNSTPDFPAAAAAMARLYEGTGRPPVDGVIAVDTSGLSALLAVTGPVTVAGQPEPVTSATLVDVLRRLPESDPAGPARVAGSVVGQAWTALTRADLGTPARLASALAPAFAGGHILVHVEGTAERQALTRLGVEGGAPPPAANAVLVVNENRSGAPVDLDLHRRLEHDIRLRPGAAPALEGNVTVVLENRADRTENRTAVSLHRPQLHQAEVTVPAGEARTVELPFRSPATVRSDGWYQIDLYGQPRGVPDSVEVTLSVPPGWFISEARGGTIQDGSVRARFDGSRRHALAVRVQRTGWANLWDTSREPARPGVARSMALDDAASLPPRRGL